MKKTHRFDHEDFLVPPGKRVRLGNYPTEPRGRLGKEDGEAALLEDVSALTAAQELLWASTRYAVLVILQGMDTSGKDGIIKHVMKGMNPQGCEVHSFKAPAGEEVGHHYLWRTTRRLPARGRIGIFNRSYYEEVIVVRVHPELLAAQKLPIAEYGKRFWKSRFEDINDHERTLTRNGTVILKFFMHLSKGEQKRRLLERLKNPEKHWKFSPADVRERGYWDDYQRAYEEVLGATSTEWAPWHVIPADKKWYARACVADILAAQIESLDLEYPRVPSDEKRSWDDAIRQLEGER